MTPDGRKETRVPPQWLTLKKWAAKQGGVERFRAHIGRKGDLLGGGRVPSTPDALNERNEAPSVRGRM